MRLTRVWSLRGLRPAYRQLNSKRQRLPAEEDEELMQDVERLEEFLDLEGTDDAFMEGVEVHEDVVELPADASEARQREQAFFEGFFDDHGGSPFGTISKQAQEDAEEVQRKLGSDVLMGADEFETLRENEEFLRSVEADGRVDLKTGFQQRGSARMTELEQQQSREKAERERQRRLHIDGDDNLCVGDVVVPPHLERWIMDPHGDHRVRYRKQRQKEERIAAWYEMHGMEQRGKKPPGFRRDPGDVSRTMRQARVGGLIRVALERTLEKDLEHEDVPGIVVEDVQISVDMRRAKVLWNCSGDPREARAFLQRMAPLIRHGVTSKVQLKYSPLLEFIQVDRLNTLRAMEKAMDHIEAESAATKRD